MSRIPHRGYTRDRLAQTEARLAALVHPEVAAVDALELSPPVDRIDRAEAQALPYAPARLGADLGPLFATHWLRVRATVPAHWADARVDLALDTRGEATLWLGGRAVQGLNSAGVQPRPDATLIARARGGERIELELELACNDPFGTGVAGTGPAAPYRTRGPFVLDRCELARFDPSAWRLLFDFAVLRALEAEAGVDPALAGELLAGLDAFATAWDGDDRATWEPAGAILTALYERHAAGGPHELSAVGHAHIDTAWLWPLEESRRKARRTFTTQLRLMDEYPEHVFAASQAQHYAWIREDDPALWEDIRARVRRGQWAPVGGTWIEPDCNLPSGESLARQLLHGQRFFERELGRRCTELWQPDVFGYTGQLPQLMRQAGMSRFLTQKLSWNRFNRPEHHTFTWQGIDGSEVLTHFPPADTYNAEATVADLRRCVRQYRDHERVGESLLVFGHGDGGGGPTRAMLERLRRARDLRGLPRTALRHPQEFFDRLEAGARDLRTIVGELYFEYHRGTYTTQAALKRGNRRCEAALHDAELLAAVAARLGRAPYPRETLTEAWRTLLVTQFHDILPGTSITEVNERARSDLAAVEAAAEDVAAVALGALGGAGEPAPVNTICWGRREVARHPGGALVLCEVPPDGAGRVVAVRPQEDVRLERTADGGAILENGYVRATLSPAGTIDSLVYKPAGREALAAPANRLELYEDRPVAWEAWDIDPAHLDTRADVPAAAGIAEARAEPLRAEVAFEREVGARSRLRQVVRLDAAAHRLEVHTTASWHEDHRLLKVAFPLAVRAAEATYESAFGAARRPTHFSTRHDLARYEVPGHRWADLSEHGFGVALLTDSKYGYSADGDTLRISLLRAPKQPDAQADMGEHAFAYALAPHVGTWQDAGVVAEARAFGAPLRWAALAPGAPWAEVRDAPGLSRPQPSRDERGRGENPMGLVLDTVKLGEDSDALVLRLYEAHGGRGLARILLGLPFSAARRSNLLEDDLGPADVDGDAILVDFRPWEIVTLLVD
ncbi:MAG TPA: glycoside hydrolase family 38 C-terminal domain-containing protein [Solirubrobacteraceae bacterium]|nr:glycoside hydrolase family 38 C-terminal domain-containing protein [Solirubrobacteraceae bacterium]